MLDVTRATRFVPGSNRKGALAGASWVFTLDRLDLGHVLFLGAPGTPALEMIAPLASEVMIWEPQAGKRRGVATWLEAAQHHNVSVAERPQASWQLQELRPDLLVHSNGQSWPSADTIAALRRPDGFFYRETQEAAWQAHRAQPGNVTSRCLRLTPLHGEIHSLVPHGDEATWRYFTRHRMHKTNLRLPLLAKAERALNRRGLNTSVKHRIGILEGFEAGTSTTPPAYLRQLALQHGRDIESHRWGLWARGGYRSQKVLFYLFDGAAETPELVVKLDRDAAFNVRLENEYAALAELHRLAPALAAHVPEPLFLGHPGKLAAVGERMVRGRPFTSRTDGSATCPRGLQAVEWLTELGRATADPVRPAQAADALHDLFTRFVAIYQPSAGEQEFLRAQIARVAASPYALPAVLQHGDPGPWNLFVRPDGTVVFLDWEAAELRGMPLWDLFYFLRSYVLLGRVRGLHSRLDSFAAAFLGESPLSSFLQQAVEHYCARVGLHPTLVEPLFFTCWMHRALKESARLHPARLGDGRFLEVLRHCIAHREAPGLDRLLRQPAGV